MKRASVARRIGFCTLLTLLIATGLRAQDARASVSGVTTNNEGVKLFEKQRMSEAYAHFVQALGEMPFDARAHFNLASSYLANKEFEKAESEFAQAAKLAAQSPSGQPVKFAALFNAAVAATELKQIDQALALYQEALSVVPDSIETKTNIELLIQSQSGGGGDSKDKKDKDPKDGKDKEQKKDGKGSDKDKPKPSEQPKDQDPQKNQPQPFNSKELTPQDAQRIMDELKRQEEQIRAKIQNDHVKDVPRDKDW